jgi:RNA polymerase sigma factor (sigma-70 family)
MVSDLRELLRQYVEEHSEEAFSRLVEIHVGLVYSVALRQGAGDVHFARDISQIVFSDLARKASTFEPGIVLAGWLYRHTCLKAAESIRSLHRRRHREEIAVSMNEANPAESEWTNEASSILDEVMQQLDETDRDALVLRFFRHESLRGVGDVFGISEDAAQKRISRAIEKLRVLLTRKGIRCSTSVLGLALAAHVNTAVPAGLAAGLSGVALSKAGFGSAAISAQTFFKIMASTKIKIGIAALIAGAVTTPLILQQSQLNRLTQENAGLLRQLSAKEKSDALKAAARQVLETDDALRLKSEHRELVKLRGQLADILREKDVLSKTGRSKTAANNNSAPIKDAAWVDEVLAGTPAQKGAAAGSLRGKMLRHEGEEISSIEVAMRDAMVKLSLNNTLERSPSDFADFQSAYIEATVGLKDPSKTQQIREMIQSTYEQAVADGLDIPSKPTTETSEWVQRRHQLDRKATEAVKSLLSTDQQKMFDTALLGVMGVDLGGVGVDKSNYPPGFLGPDTTPPGPSGIQ